jgi:hypothetical protein
MRTPLASRSVRSAPLGIEQGAVVRPLDLRHGFAELARQR